MPRLAKLHTLFFSQYGRCLFFVTLAGVGLNYGCALRTDSPVDILQVSGENTMEGTQNQRSVLLQQTQTGWYEHMIAHGQYSDAAIQKNFRYMVPLHSPPDFLFKNISTSFATPPHQKQTKNAPGYTESSPQLNADWHVQVGWGLILDGNYQGAEAAYRQALRQNNKSAKAYLGLGMALSLQGERQRAISAYEKAIHFQPDYAAALVHLGYAYTEGNSQDQNIKKARSLFQQASKLGDPFALVALLDIQEGKDGV